MADERTILHVDLDAFFASVEQLDRPEVRGKPVLVGHDGPRGVVAAASYEARVFGCHSAQPMVIAKRRCPQAVILPPRFGRYKEQSARVFDLLRRLTPLVEPVSIDEAFLDLAGCQRLLGPAEVVARRLKETVRTETGLTLSVGVAPNKFLAKLASDLSKPNGLKIIRPQDIDELLPPLPVGRIWGVGPKSAAKLHAVNIRTIGDLRRQTPQWFESWFASDGTRVRELAFGIDARTVEPDSPAKSLSHEQTFGADVADADEVRRVLRGQVDRVARELRQDGLAARSVTVKIRFGDFQTVTRSKTLAAPTHVTDALCRAAVGLFDGWAEASFRPVRLIGIAAGHLGPRRDEGQMTLFAPPQAERHRRLDSVLDRIQDRFGIAAIRRGDSG